MLDVVRYTPLLKIFPMKEVWRDRSRYSLTELGQSQSSYA
jgi:hypothetical protein